MNAQSKYIVSIKFHAQEGQSESQIQTHSI